jgi:hypothetical protein
MPKLPSSAYSATAPVPGSGFGSRRIARPIALFANARLCVVTGVVPVFGTNCERNT